MAFGSRVFAVYSQPYSHVSICFNIQTFARCFGKGKAGSSDDLPVAWATAAPNQELPAIGEGRWDVWDELWGSNWNQLELWGSFSDDFGWRTGVWLCMTIKMCLATTGCQHLLPAQFFRAVLVSLRAPSYKDRSGSCQQLYSHKPLHPNREKQPFHKTAITTLNITGCWLSPYHPWQTSFIFLNRMFQTTKLQKQTCSHHLQLIATW